MSQKSYESDSKILKNFSWKNGILLPKFGEGVKNCGEGVPFAGEGVNFEAIFTKRFLPTFRFSCFT
jgi:hypothetical protein